MKVDDQPAFILHTRPYRETSLMADVLTRDYGRMSVLARSARRPQSLLRGQLLAFQPLRLGWSGKGEVKTLMKLEWQGGLPLPMGEKLFCAYYANELLIKFLPREDADRHLFTAYQRFLVHLADSNRADQREEALRHFESALLSAMGYGLTLTQDARGEPIVPNRHYRCHVGNGIFPVDNFPTNDHATDLPPADNHEITATTPLSCVTDQQTTVLGQTLIELATGKFSAPVHLREAKRLMRLFLNHHLAGDILHSREIYRQLQEL